MKGFMLKLINYQYSSLDTAGGPIAPDQVFGLMFHTWFDFFFFFFFAKIWG